MFDWNQQQWKNLWIGWAWTIASFAFFRLLQFVVRWYLFGKCTFRTFSYFHRRVTGNPEADAAMGDSTRLSNVPPNKKWRICNESVSLIHSVVSGLWAAYIILFYKDIISDMINYRCDVAVGLVFLSAGYLLHDLLDLLINERSVRIIELLFHHFIVLAAFAVTMVTDKYLGVVIFGLLMELNSIFLHSRSMLNLYGTNKKSPQFRMVALLNMVTLIVFRVAVSAYLFYWMVTTVGSLQWHIMIPISFIITSLCVSNCVLSYRVMAADGLFGKKRARKNVNPGAVEGPNDEDDDDSSNSDDGPVEVAVQTPGVEEVESLVANGTQTTS